MRYDLVVIGAGWAGYSAAVRARQLGLKVGLCEKNEIGGTCLNRGCIATKALIQSAKLYASIKYAGRFGVKTSPPQVDFSAVQANKTGIISRLQKNLQAKLSGVDLIPGEAKVISADRLEIAGRQLSARSIIVATGSNPVSLANLAFDNKTILSSEQILAVKDVPESILIIGGGVIGCEFASLFSLFGTQVSVAEKMPRLLPHFDHEISQKIEAIFTRRGIKVYTGSSASAVNPKDFKLTLVSTGRCADTQHLGLEKAGVAIDRGAVHTDDYMRTSAAGIYAVGDCTGRVMLAHAAQRQGIIAAENIACSGKGDLTKFSDAFVPACVFTSPEIAAVGMTQDSAQERGIEVRINKFDFLGSGMARIRAETGGFIKIISRSTDGLLLGGSIIGPDACELIGILTLALSSGLKVSDLRQAIFAHPTLSEGIGLAVQ